MSARSNAIVRNVAAIFGVDLTSFPEAALDLAEANVETWLQEERAEERSAVVRYLFEDAEVAEIGREFMRQDDGRKTLNNAAREIEAGKHREQG